jgi:hypothetical protein
MKNREIIEHINAIGAFTKDKMPTKLSFAVVKNFNKLQAAYKDYDQARLNLIDIYAEKDDEGKNKLGEDGTAIIKTDSQDTFLTEINELLDIEVEIDVHMVDYSVIENIQLAVADMAAIEFMIKE